MKGVFNAGLDLEFLNALSPQELCVGPRPTLKRT